MAQIRSFEDLEVYKLARQFRNKIYDLTKKLPNNEKYNLIDQMRRASISLTSNIAEGYGRYHYQENIQFCRQARGSLNELMDQLMACSDLGYIDKKTIESFLTEAQKICRYLNAYIKSTITRQKSSP
ncbi:MAG: four helix bundle protein [Candidatus Aminicenantales bacterium]